ncbi:uncharacterized protein DS421_12g369330 [Arachis hypogaea]|nr:uncharacterized protein DS421_12g369330 [Arachis hypogaea]
MLLIAMSNMAWRSILLVLQQRKMWQRTARISLSSLMVSVWFHCIAKLVAKKQQNCFIIGILTCVSISNLVSELYSLPF